MQYPGGQQPYPSGGQYPNGPPYSGQNFNGPYPGPYPSYTSGTILGIPYSTWSGYSPYYGPYGYSQPMPRWMAIGILIIFIIFGAWYIYNRACDVPVLGLLCIPIKIIWTVLVFISNGIMWLVGK